jgi:NADPH:quinone reductase-like Zn-dependent oxidoreductase
MMMTDAWVLKAGPSNPAPGALVREPFGFSAISENEVLAEPIYGCWEGNMTHALNRQPIDVCRQRGEDRVVLGNAGVVRILERGRAVENVSVGDVCVLVSVDLWDEFGYPMKILAYDAPGTMGVLAKIIKLNATQVFTISKESQRSLQQWASFPIRYATAWDNWKVALGALRLQMCEQENPRPYVWAWGGGVSLAELLLAKSQGCETALVISNDYRRDLCQSLGITAIDRRLFPDLTFDAMRFREDFQYRKRYTRSESVFLDLVKQHTNGQGVSIFIDNIGGPVFRATCKALARQGVITTCGWKEGAELQINRASECINRHVHVFTHGSKNTQDALEYAEHNDWMAPILDDVCEWEDIPSLADAYNQGKIKSYFPIFKVNDF